MIVLYIDTKYQDSTNFTYLKSPTEDYTPFYSIDVVDHKILLLKNIDEDKKSKIWKRSFIKEEVLNYFPNMKIMQEVYCDRVVDNGLFKKRFFEYMIELQNSYIGGEIDEEEFKKSFLNPPF